MSGAVWAAAAVPPTLTQSSGYVLLHIVAVLMVLWALPVSLLSSLADMPGRERRYALAVITTTLAAGLMFYTFFGLFGYYYVAALLGWPRSHALVAAGTEWAVVVLSLSLVGLAVVVRLQGSSQYVLRGALLFAALCGLGLLTFEFSPELGATWHASLSLSWILIGTAAWPAGAKTKAVHPPVAAKT